MTRTIDPRNARNETLKTGFIPLEAGNSSVSFVPDASAGATAFGVFLEDDSGRRLVGAEFGEGFRPEDAGVAAFMLEVASKGDVSVRAGIDCREQIRVGGTLEVS